MSSSLGSSISGMRRVRTTTRWLATPRVTDLPSLFFEKKDLSSLERASASWTSPSETMPGSSGAIAVLETAIEPFALISVAAMLPASISRPTLVLGLLFELSCMPYSIGASDAWRHTRFR